MDDASVVPIAPSIGGESGIAPGVVKKPICVPRRRKRITDDGAFSNPPSTEKKSVRPRLQRKKAKAPSCAAGITDDLGNLSTTSDGGHPAVEPSPDDLFEDLEDEPALQSNIPPLPQFKQPGRKRTGTGTTRKRKNRATTRKVVVEYRDPRLVMLIDRRELGGNRKQAGDLEAHLRKYAPAMNYDIRTLPLGDFVWVCQVTEVFREEAVDAAPGDTGMEEAALQERKSEFVLPWIVERKTLSDLLESVHGTRYRDQKARLIRFLQDPSNAVGHESSSCPLASAVQCIEPTGILLVEACHDLSLNQPIFHQQYYDLPPNDKNARNTVVGAQINSQARDNLMLLQTANLDHTAAMLTKLHSALDRKFSQLIPHFLDVVVDAVGKSRRLSFLSYGTRYKPGARETVSSLLEQQLRLVPGVTPIIAEILTQEYQTPARLVKAIKRFESMAIHEKRVLSGVGQKALEGLFNYLVGRKISWADGMTNDENEPPPGSRVVHGEEGGKGQRGRPSIRIPLDLLDDDMMEPQGEIVNNIMEVCGGGSTKSAVTGGCGEVSEEAAESSRLIERIRQVEMIEARMSTQCGDLTKEGRGTIVKVSPERANLTNVTSRSLEGADSGAPDAPRRQSLVSPALYDTAIEPRRGRVSVVEY